MAYIDYDKLWESDFNNNVSKNEKVQDINRNQFKSRST